MTWVALRTMSALHPTKDCGLNYRKFPCDWDINSSFIEFYEISEISKQEDNIV